jgi:hypothetical protein
MGATRFDRISKAFATRRLSRRQTLATGAAGLAAGALAGGVDRAGVAQEATSTSDLLPPNAEHGPTMLFLQTYEFGTITPIEGIDGRYTLTLEAGTGQTIYFSDRPDCIVGTGPTPPSVRAKAIAACRGHRRSGWLPGRQPTACRTRGTGRSARTCAGSRPRRIDRPTVRARRRRL